MAKISFSKLGLKKNESVKTVKFNDVDIEVKQYLSIEEKLTLVSNVLSNCANASENKFANPIHVDVFTTLEILYAYSNITFTDKQREDVTKLFDLVEEGGLASAVIAAIPEEEYNFLIDSIGDTITSYYEYLSSALGIMEQISSDYKDVKYDAESIEKSISNPDNLTFLKDVMTKLG